MDDISTKNIEMNRDLVAHIVETGDVPYRYLLGPYTEEGYDFRLANNFDSLLRDEYITKCSYSLISHGWVSKLAKVLEGKNCIELYSGKGLLGHTLRDSYNIDIECTDNYDWNNVIDYSEAYTKIRHIDALDAVKSYDKNTLDYILCSWIPYQDTVCADVVKELSKNQKKCKIIFIGEDYGGCTAGDLFFDLTDDITHDKYTKKFFKRINKNYQSWPSIYDEVFLFKPRRMTAEHED